MKYLVIFDDEDLKDYRTDDKGLTLVLTDKTMSTRAKKLIPIARPLAFNTDGMFAYLSDGHIDCIKKYEEEQSLKRMIDNMWNEYCNFYGSGKYALEPYMWNEYCNFYGSRKCDLVPFKEDKNV